VIICKGNDILIGKAPVAGNAYAWLPTHDLSSSSSSQPTANPGSTTAYTLTETNLATGCTNSGTSVVVVNPLPLAITGPGKTIYAGLQVSIGAASISGHTYKWTPIAGLDFSNISQPNASPSVNTLYTLTETDTLSGCVNSNSVEISMVEIEFFNGFSPNGDGKNDTWRIPILDVYPQNDVIIVNRWGSEVWSTNNYSNTTNIWSGQNKNGVDLPDGTYYYIIRFNNEEKRGWVIIKR
jgi:gliding motility-associated-like protein